MLVWTTRTKVAVAGAIILLLEPVAVSITGGTVGHHLVGIRVRRIHADVRLNLPLALIRFVVKAAFGLPAFFVVLVTRRRQGLHDLAARSLVVHKSTEGLPDHEILGELTREDEHRAYVSIWRRLLVIVFYWSIFFLGWGIVVQLSVSRQCVEDGVCTEMESYFLLAGVAMLLLTAIVIAVLGWLGLLYGCRRRPLGVV